MSLGHAIASMERDYEIVRKHLPAQARKFGWRQVLIFFSIFGLLGSLLALLGDAVVLAGSCALFFLIMIILAGTKNHRLLKLAKQIGDAKEHTILESISTLRHDAILSRDSLKLMATEMKKQSDDIKAISRASGDTIISGDITVSGQGVVIIGSELVNSMNQNPAVADDLKILAGFVQKAADELKQGSFERIDQANKCR